MRNKLKQAQPNDENPLLAVMRRYGAPMTREEFLKLRYLGNVPDVIDPEVEADIPDELQ